MGGAFSRFKRKPTGDGPEDAQAEGTEAGGQDAEREHYGSTLQHGAHQGGPDDKASNDGTTNDEGKEHQPGLGSHGSYNCTDSNDPQFTGQHSTTAQGHGHGQGSAYDDAADGYHGASGTGYREMGQDDYGDPNLYSTWLCEGSQPHGSAWGMQHPGDLAYGMGPPASGMSALGHTGQRGGSYAGMPPGRVQWSYARGQPYFEGIDAHPMASIVRGSSDGSLAIHTRAVQIHLLLALARVYLLVGRTAASDTLRQRNTSYTDAHISKHMDPSNASNTRTCGPHGGSIPAASAWATEEVLWERWFRSQHDLPPTQHLHHITSGSGMGAQQQGSASFACALAAEGWVSVRDLSMVQLTNAFTAPHTAQAGCSWVEAVMHEPEQAMLGAMLDSYSRYLQGPLRAADHDSPSPVQASPVPAVLQYCRVPGPTQYTVVYQETATFGAVVDVAHAHHMACGDAEFPRPARYWLACLAIGPRPNQDELVVLNRLADQAMDAPMVLKASGGV